jgi:hypothetical protein
MTKPETKSKLEVLDSGGCCSTETPKTDLHSDLAKLLKLHDINDYAASVKVFAVKKHAG